MRLRTAFLIAAMIIVGMFVFRHIMGLQTLRWMHEVKELSATDLFLARIAMIGQTYWIVLAPGIAAIFLAVSFITTRWET